MLIFHTLQRLLPGRRIATRPVRRARRGGAVLEMAILAPVLIYLSFGAVEYGYFMYVKNTVFSAARDGARAAIVSGASNATVFSAVNTAMSNSGLAKLGYTITGSQTVSGTTSQVFVTTVSTSGSSSTSGSDVSTIASGNAVSVQLSFTWGAVHVHPLPTVMGGIDPTKNVTATATMRKE